MGGGGGVAGRIARGEVRFYSFLAPDRSRPLVIPTREAAIGHLSTVLIPPIRSTIRGVPSEVALNEDDGMKGPCAVNLHNTTVVSQERLGKRVTSLSERRMAEICAALRFSVGCD